MTTNVLIQKITTGDYIVFNKESRDLVLIEHDACGEHTEKLTFDAALDLAKGGRAHHYDRVALERLQAALAGIVLLV